MKKLFKNLLPLLLLVAGLGISPNALGDAGYYPQDGKNSTLELQVNDGNSTWIDRTNNADTWVINDALYTMTLKTFYVYVWQDNGTGISWTKMYYNIHKDGQTTSWNSIDGGWCADKEENNKEYGKKDINMDILADCTEPGTYYLDYNFDTDNAGQLKNQKNSGNFCVKFTIPDYYVKNTWGGESWSWKKLDINNYDGTYSVKVDAYSTGGLNYNTKSDDTGSEWQSSPTCSPTTPSGRCLVTFNRATKAISVTQLSTLTFKNEDATVETIEVLYNQSATAPAAPSKTGYNFLGWSKDGGLTKIAAGATISNVQADATYEAQWTPNTNTAYTVKHYKQNLTLTDYELAETENLTGTTGASVTPTTKSYTGFTAPNTQTASILADGSLVIEYQYTRNTHTFAWDWNGGSTSSDSYTAANNAMPYGTAITYPANNTMSRSGYNFDGWSSDATTMPDNDLTITAQWEEAASFTVTYVAPDKTGGDVPSDATAYTLNAQVTVLGAGSLVRIGYDFAGWKSSVDNNTYTANQTFTISSNVTLTAQWTAHNYSITYNGLEGGTHFNPTTYTIETATFALADASRDDYTFDGWFDAETEGNKVTSIEQGSTGNITLWARWHETLHNVNLIANSGISSISPNVGATNIGNVTPVQIEATVEYGYTWDKWTLTGNVTTTSNVTDNPISVKATGTGTVTATATEKTVTLTPTVNDDNMGTVSDEGTVGIATGLQLTATKKDGYKFDHWVLSGNLAIQDSKTVNDNPITVKTNGDGNAVSAQAVFVEDLSTGVYLQSNGITPTAWADLEAFEFKKLTGQSTSNDAYLTITTTEDEQYNYVYGTKDNNQFILHDSHGDEGKRILSLEKGYWFINSYAVNTTLNQFGSNGYENMRFFSTVPGTYTFHYNLNTRAFDITYPDQYSIQICDGSGQWTAHNFVNNAVSISLSASTDIRFRVVYQGAYYGNVGKMTKDNCTGWTMENNSTTRKECWINTVKAGLYIFSFNTENKQLSVTYPEETYQTVTVYEDGVTPKEVKVYEVSKPSITAQVPEGMNFNGWVTTGDATVDNASSTTTTVTNAGTDGTVKATFNTTQYIYFKDGVYDKYGNVWVTFRKTDYWDNSNGSGNKDLSYAALGMTKIKNTDIHYFHIDNEHATWEEVTWGIVQFTNSGNIQQNFYLTKVAYPHHNNSQSCYRACLPLFVPRDWITTNINSSQYYNDGIWMKYNSTESGFRIKGSWDSWTSDDYKFVAETPGGYEFKTTLQLTAGTTYDFKIYDDDNRTYSIKGVMTATSCSNWHMYMDQDNCQITASETGNYTFILNLGSGEVIVSVEYPLSASDYRVVAKLGDEVKWEGDLIKNSNNTAKKDTTSFFNNNYTYQLQQYAGEGTWNDVADQIVTPPDSAKQGVINFIVTQDGNGSATLAYEGIYTGNYYIRTDGVDGGWGDYENNSDNKMDNYGSLIDADPEYQYDVYKAKWITSGKNVKFRIANDYSKAISDELKGDAVIGNDKETLPQSANVRFMWNSTTNQLKRAYLSGSSNASDRYLILEGDDKMFDENGDALNVSGLDPNELNFKDMNNWVYQADIQAQPGCEVKLTAKYNGKVQYFIGKEGDGDDSRRKIIDGSGTDKYNLRAVYDFKTNRLVAGWIPSGTIESNIILGSDMLIERTEHGEASQIVFGGETPASLSISKIQHIYGVLKLTKETMTSGTKTDYEKSIYWISFPFDVKVSEIFGLDKYGEVWVISKYCGEKRAQKGWFKQDTESFWEFMGANEIMKANVGYTLNLDPDYFNKETSKPWENSATEISWYFPSIQENVGVVSLAQKDTTLAPQHCDIDREFNIGTEQDPIMVNHKFTDSNWRTIGVPAFQNLQAPDFNPAPTQDPENKKTFGLTGFYEWQPTSNTYIVQSTSEYTFKASHGYMVQYEGKITWSNAAVITTNAPEVLAAPAYETEEAKAKNYSIKLEFGHDTYTDQAFVILADEASTDFVLNEDMMKIDNAGYPNIYSFAGNYNVAYNETKMDNQSVMLGVSAPKAGTYTFSMPNQFSGTAKLVDLVEGTTTDLNVSNYSVDLSKGTYNDRFQLLLEVEAKAPTSMENVDCGWWMEDGKTTKLLRDGNIYLINGGRVYNVLGVEE